MIKINNIRTARATEIPWSTGAFSGQVGRGMGKNTQYFFNLEKSMANSNIMERMTDKRGQADIMNVQRDFFSNLYERKRDKEGTEE